MQFCCFELYFRQKDAVADCLVLYDFYVANKIKNCMMCKVEVDEL